MEAASAGKREVSGKAGWLMAEPPGDEESGQESIVIVDCCRQSESREPPSRQTQGIPFRAIGHHALRGRRGYWDFRSAFILCLLSLTLP